MSHSGSRLAFDIPKIAAFVSMSLPFLAIGFGVLGFFFGPWWHIGTALFLLLTIVNIYFKYVQTKHAILRNFGLMGAMRYMIESVGPEFRQYLYANDIEERPFNRMERAEVYRKAKDVDSASAFGSQLDFSHHELKIRHSFFPKNKEDLKPYSCTFGEERKVKHAYTMKKPFMISAMSFGSLGEHAVRALARGAKKADILMNTGEGGLTKYHLEEGANLIFQMGTAKFGCRNDDHTLNEEKLKKIVAHKRVKMVEIKFSQGAKPGKGGLLPKEKITKEIAEIRHIPMDKDVVSPPRHVECDSPENTVKFIKKVQDVAEKPVGIKFCLGSEKEFRVLVDEMKKQKVFPDYIDVDGAQGGTGAAPKSFMDAVGMPVMDALPLVNQILIDEGIRDKMKLVASGKLISPSRQLMAMAYGADAVYSARGFMLAIGCIQALICNTGNCPVGITTHDKKLQRGLDIESKSERVKNYIKNLEKELKELLTAAGCGSHKELKPEHIFRPI